MSNTYKLIPMGVLLNGVSHVPESIGNRHWQAYQDWLSEGNTPDPADVVVIVPPEDTLLTPEDTERLLLGIPGVTKAKITKAKKDRGKPLP